MAIDEYIDATVTEAKIGESSDKKTAQVVLVTDAVHPETGLALILYLTLKEQAGKGKALRMPDTPWDNRTDLAICTLERCVNAHKEAGRSDVKSVADLLKEASKSEDKALPSLVGLDVRAYIGYSREYERMEFDARFPGEPAPAKGGRTISDEGFAKLNQLISS